MTCNAAFGEDGLNFIEVLVRASPTKTVARSEKAEIRSTNITFAPGAIRTDAVGTTASYEASDGKGRD